MHTPAVDLNPGDTYTAGDPTDPANTVTVVGRPYVTDQRIFGGRTVTVLRIPVRTHDGTHVADVVRPDGTVNKN